MKKITGIMILIWFIPGLSFAIEPAEQLKRYHEKMDYWFERSDNALKCANRFTTSMFIYDATFENGTHPSEELSKIIELKTLEKTDCIVNALKVLDPERLDRVIEHFYTNPLIHEPHDFEAIINQLRS